MTGALLAAALLLGAERQDPSDGGDLLESLLAGLLGEESPETPETLQARVTSLGGVPFRRPVELDYLDPAALSGYLRELVDADYPPAQADAEARMLVAFDLLEPATDLRALRLRLLEQNVVGFYDDRPGRKRLYAVSSTRDLNLVNRIVLVHELRHALQDQYAELRGVLPATVGDFDDRRMAFMSLVEGDATLVMMRYLEQLFPTAGALGEAALPTPPVEGAPPVLRDQLVRPYLSGLAFARSLDERGGFAALKEAWSRPPRSTEQVLHPEKLASGDEPRAVTITWSPPGGRVLVEGVLGEMLAGTLLDGDGPATAGWGGDLFRAWDLSGATLLLWRSAWDTPADEREFGAALRERFEASHGPSLKKGPFRVFTRRGWRVAVGSSGGETVLISSDAPAAFEAALAAHSHP